MESSKTWRTEALKSFAISESGMQGAKDVRTRRPDTPSEGDGTWVVAGCRNDIARLAYFSQWSGQHIRIGYAIVRGMMFTSAVCFSLRESGQGSAPRVLLGNPDGVAPDSDARSMSSGGGVPTPCTSKRSPLRRSTFSGYLTSEILSGRLSTLSGYFTSGAWRRMGEEGVSTSPIRHIRILL